MRIKTILITVLVFASFLCPSLSIYAQRPVAPIDILVDPELGKEQIFANVAKQSTETDVSIMFEKLFGPDATEAASVLSGGDASLLLAVSNTASLRAEEKLDAEIKQ